MPANNPVEISGQSLKLTTRERHKLTRAERTIAKGLKSFWEVGMALKAIREDEIAAEAMGINTTRYKIQAFALGSFMAGVGGGLYAHFLSYINPSDFGFLKSVDILSMVVLGGLGSVPGTVIGSSVLASAPEFLRFMSQYRMLVYGALLVFLMVFRPNGLLGGVNFMDLCLRAIGKKPAGVALKQKK